MKRQFLRDRPESLAKALLAVAVLLGALTFLKIGAFVNSSKARMMAAETEPNHTGADDLQKVLAQTKAAADDIKKNNLFVPAPAHECPISGVIGILGQEALVGDKWYKVGDRVGDAKIVAIEPTKVKVLWDGKEKEFSPIASSAGESGDRSGRSGARSPSRGGRAAAAGARRTPNQGAGAISAADRQKLRERWVNASPEERQRFREEMRQRTGRRGR